MLYTCIFICNVTDSRTVRSRRLVYSRRTDEAGQPSTHAADTYAGRVRNVKGKGSPYSITERRVPELIPVLGSQPAGDVRHKPGGRLPLLSARSAVTPAALERAAANFAAWRTEA